MSDPIPSSDPGDSKDERGAAGNAREESDGWERDLLNRLAFAALIEQRRARRWTTVFRFAILAYLVVVLVLYAPKDWLPLPKGDKHTALIEIRGTIADDSDASADRVITGLRAAFEDENTAGVILRINSPGGSPVQAGYISDEMKRLRAENMDIPIYAVITDVAASGGYYVAANADKVYADKSSMVGSIGVLMNGFGFVDAMDKLGIERRLLTAGDHKGLLDPFSPSRPEEVSHLSDLLQQVHRQFIDVVKLGRGDRLSTDADLFSGLIWTGEESAKLGLVDALGSSSFVAREIIGQEEIVDFTPRRSYLELLAKRIGANLGQILAGELRLGTFRLR